MGSSSSAFSSSWQVLSSSIAKCCGKTKTGNKITYGLTIGLILCSSHHRLFSHEYTHAFLFFRATGFSLAHPSSWHISRKVVFLIDSKQVINQRQLSWLASSIVTSGGILTLQNVLIRINQMDAWFSYLLSIFYVFLIAGFFGYMAKHYPQKNIFEIPKNY